MDEDEIKNAIEKLRLPIRASEFISYTLIGLVWLAAIYQSLDQHTLVFFIPPFFISVLIFAFIWRYFNLRKLSPYLSNRSIHEKSLVLERLVAETNITDIQRESYHLQFYLQKKTWFANHYDITILYDESGYYINTIKKNWERDGVFSKGKSQYIITQIRKFEIEL